MDIPALIKEFMRYKVGQQHKKFSTAQRYGDIIRHFFSKVEKFPEQITSEDVVNFIIYMKVEAKLANNTQKLKVSAIKSFFAWYARRYQADDPTKDVAPIQEEIKVPVMPTPDELVRMVYECDVGTERGRRDAAIICLIADTGIRIGECAALNLGNIQLHENNFTVIVPGIKGRWERIVPFGRLINGDLIAEHWAAYWEEIKFSKHWRDSEPLFKSNGHRPDHRGSRLSSTGIYNRVIKFVKKAGLNEGITAHSLRHFFATYSTIAGIDIHRLKYLMGHAWISSTERYIHIAESIKHETINLRGTVGLKSRPQFTGYSNIARQIHKQTKNNKPPQD